ncbi:MAG: hypothetical protein ACLFM7_07235 [Bacteroidales bacterium]
MELLNLIQTLSMASFGMGEASEAASYADKLMLCTASSSNWSSSSD